MADDSRERHATKTIQIQAVPAEACDNESRQAFVTVVRGGTDLGSLRVIEHLLVIGRDPSCDLPLHDLGISWRHACIRPTRGGGAVLEDLASTNGTRVNGRPVTRPIMLSDGDKIFLGDTILRFSLADQVDLGFQQEVCQLVAIDTLTGLETKRVFDEALAYALAAASQAQQPLSLLMMDLDGIKAINDTHGHLFGAHTIAEAGRIIGEVLKGQGQACRFGGDEFTAYLPAQDRAKAQTTAERIRLAILQAGIQKDGVPLHPTISIGVAAHPEDGSSAGELVAAADAALYRAKATGKNRVCC